MTSPAQIKEVSKVTRDLASQAPGLTVAGLIVVFFLVFLDRQQSQGNLLAEMRIEQCHDVQRESMRVMQTLTESLAVQSKAFYDLIHTMELHNTRLDEGR